MVEGLKKNGIATSADLDIIALIASLHRVGNDIKQVSGVAQVQEVE